MTILLYIMLALIAQASFILLAILGLHLLHWARLRKRGPIEDGAVGSSGAEVVVTFVHGTFTPGGGALSTNSALAHALRQKLAGKRMEIRTIQWTGWNTLTSRRHGASILIKHIRRIRRGQPYAKHFIVAHSHGGNVALDAVQSGMTSRAISGMVSISTPYLVFLPVMSFKQLSYAIELAMKILLFIAWLMLFGFIHGNLPGDTEAGLSWRDGLDFFLAFFTLVIVSFPIALAGDRLQRTARRLNRFLANDATTTSALIVRTPSDEATLLLTTLMAIARIQMSIFLLAVRFSRVARVSVKTRLLRLPAWVREGVVTHALTGPLGAWLLRTWTTVLVISMLATHFIVWSAVFDVVQYYPRWFVWSFLPIAIVMAITGTLLILDFSPVFFLLFIGLCLLPVVFFFAAMLAPLAILVSIICAAAIGPGLTLGSFLSLPSIEGTPLGNVEVVNIIPGHRAVSGSTSPSVLRLLHSSALEDRNAIKAICDWIAVRV
ncbi:hypothetical protein [Bradyrhizobium sp. McL0615]|uniref:hypothetical protein n=1 Tax=Bradyrhizobium sp. McL0615 TaxID=3415673 RepID=UPI003CEFA89D